MQEGRGRVKAYNRDLVDEMLVVGVVVQEVSRDASDDGRGGPDHEVRGGDDRLSAGGEGDTGHYVDNVVD